MAHWRSHRHHGRRLYRNQPRELTSRGRSIFAQLAALILFTVASFAVVLCADVAWLGWVALAVWFFGLERIVKQTRRD